MKLIKILGSIFVMGLAFAKPQSVSKCDIYVCDLKISQSTSTWFENDLEIREPCQSCISSSEVHQGDFVFKIEIPSKVMLKMDLKYKGRALMAFGVPRGISDINFESEKGTIRCHNKSLDLKANQERLESLVENMLSQPDDYTKEQFIETREQILHHIVEGGEFNQLLLSLFLKLVKELRIEDLSQADYKKLYPAQG
jgi:hypothetical protein